MVQWLELCAFTEGTGSILAQELRAHKPLLIFLQAVQHSKRRKKSKLNNILIPPFGNYHIVIGLVKSHRWMLKLVDESLMRNRI